jgi:gamma-glutamylcyclotransferase (GGCT)/AIG2-like uncharacterized protein YtfP
MSEYLFAYGTLQPARAPAEVAALAAKLRPVGEGFVRGALYDLGQHPGAVPDSRAKSRIAGTVMELPEDENFLRLLDDYEGFGPKAAEASEFVRERQMVELSDQRRLECWFYRYNGKPDEARIIASGAWQK